MDPMVKAAAARLRRIEAERDRAAAERRARAQEYARALAERFGRMDPSLRAVVGFGSTFETWRAFRPDSDIDLGLIGGNLSLLEPTLEPSEFDVSLVELDYQRESFRTLVLSRGTVLYEKR